MRTGLVLLLAALALVVGHAAYLSLFGFGTCTVAANEAGQPANPAHCQVQPSPPALVITALLAGALAGVALRQPAVAWSGVLLALGLAVLFGLGVGGALLPHVGLMLLGVAAERLLRRSRRLEGPPPAR